MIDEGSMPPGGQNYVKWDQRFGVLRVRLGNYRLLTRDSSGAAKALWTQQGDDVIVVPSSERQVCGMKRKPKRKISDQNQDLRLGI